MLRRSWLGMIFGLITLGMPGVVLAQESEPAEEEVSEELSEEEGADEAPAAEEGAEEEEGAADTAEPMAGEPAAEGGKVGPGGRPLRTDYPGTDEALRERMETDRIQGVAKGDVSSTEVYDLRVKELETRIDDLKDKVFRSKSRIVLLKETLLGDKVAGSKALITQKNELGRRFTIKRITYMLDGNVLRNELDRDGSLSEKKELELLSGAIGPGTHKLVAKIEFQGNAAVFGYFEGYEFELERQCRFTVEEGAVTVVDVVAFRGGGVNTSVDKSPELRCDISKADITADDVAPSMPKTK